MKLRETLIATCCLVVSAIALPVGSAAAAPVVSVVNAEGGIYWRSAPDWNTPVAVVRHGVYDGDRVELRCYERGGTVPPYYNNPLWYQARVVSGFGIGEGLLNDHFLDTGVNVPNIVVSGVPACGAAPSRPSSPPASQPTPPSDAPPPPESAPSAPSAPEAAPSGTANAERAAIAWARPYANSHSGRFDGLCLTFVFRAYEAAGVSLRPWVTRPIGENTYPIDIWGHFSHGHTGRGTPPAGSLVFYKSSRREWSHVTLAVGGGREISTSDSVANYIHYETVAQHNGASGATYLGWWLPDR